MALTLVEAAKAARGRGETVRAEVIEIFARSSAVLNAMPFADITGAAYRYTQQSALPGIAFRGVNQGFTESTGVLNPLVEPLMLAGGDMDVDNFLVQTGGTEARAAQTAMAIAGTAQKIHYAIIKGDQTSSPTEFDGLQVRLTGTQVLSNNTAANGGALSLTKLDEAIERVDGPTGIICSKAIVRLLTAASRNSSVGGYITYSQNQMGQKVTMYQGLPLLVADANDIATANQALGANEAYTGGGTADGTSLYPIAFGSGRLQGIQNGGIQARDLGEQDSKPVWRMRVEWYVGLVLEHPRAACRLRDVDPALAVVA